jgi:anaerobic selenocysteine-containing dehydrogenase
MAIEQIHTYCAMCISQCGVIATVEEGRFTKVNADPEHPNGCICVKGTAAPEIVYSPERLQYPMKRTRPKGDPDPGWTRISWDEALTLAASRLLDIQAQYGAESVVFSRATPAGNATADIDPWVTRLANAFGSPNILTTTHICTWNRGWGAKYTYGVVTPTPDYDHTRCMLLWGINPHAADPAAAMRISQARKRGAKLIVIDPRQHSLAQKADCWLRIRPGYDDVLALGMVHVLLEEKLYDEAFVREWTNGPFLVREDTRQFLTPQDLAASEAPGGFLVWDDRKDRAVSYHPENGYTEAQVEPALFGAFTVRLADGTEVRCRPALALLQERASQYAPEQAAHMTWVAADDVRRAVRLFATEQPSCYATWVGLEQHSNAMQTNRAVQCFYALTGQFDQCGSNVFFASTPARPVAGGNLLPKAQAMRRLGLAEHPLGPPSDPGLVQAAEVYQAILTGEPYPVKAMVFFGSDPLLGHGDSRRGKAALEALDFYVHVDMFANPSAAFADLLLPACTAWECEIPKATFVGAEQTAVWSQLKRAVVQPLYESRPDLEIIFDLAQRLQLGEHFFDGDLEAAWNHHLEPSGLTVEQLRAYPVGIKFETQTRFRKYAEIDTASAGRAASRPPRGG